MNYKQKDVTIFLATRNRNNLLPGVLDNIKEFCPDCYIVIANCSSEEQREETSTIISSSGKDLNIEEVVYEVDPGLIYVYADLFYAIETPLAMVWSDDTYFLEPLEPLLKSFDDPRILVAALPMIDDLRGLPGSAGWPKDKQGCALWETPTGRCSNHTIARVEHFHKFQNMRDLTVDGYFHQYSYGPNNRYWPDYACMLHTRFADDTRKGCLLTPTRFRDQSRATPELIAARDKDDSKY